MTKNDLMKKYKNMHWGHDGEWAFFEANAQRFSFEPKDDNTPIMDMLDDEAFCSFLDEWFSKSE